MFADGNRKEHRLNEKIDSTFSVSVLLTVQHLEAQTAVTDTVFLKLYNDSVDLKEVVVKVKKHLLPTVVGVI